MGVHEADTDTAKGADAIVDNLPLHRYFIQVPGDDQLSILNERLVSSVWFDRAQNDKEFLGQLYEMAKGLQGLPDNEFAGSELEYAVLQVRGRMHREDVGVVDRRELYHILSEWVAKEEDDGGFAGDSIDNIRSYIDHIFTPLNEEEQGVLSYTYLMGMLQNQGLGQGVSFKDLKETGYKVHAEAFVDALDELILQEKLEPWDHGSVEDNGFYACLRRYRDEDYLESESEDDTVSLGLEYVARLRVSYETDIANWRNANDFAFRLFEVFGEYNPYFSLLLFAFEDDELPLEKRLAPEHLIADAKQFVDALDNNIQINQLEEQKGKYSETGDIGEVLMGVEAELEETFGPELNNAYFTMSQVQAIREASKDIYPNPESFVLALTGLIPNAMGEGQLNDF
jgi:hypothetical protein